MVARIALIGENSIEYVDKLLSIWNSGNCAVLLDWRIPFETAYRMMLEAHVETCYIESSLLLNETVETYSDISFITFRIADRKPHLLLDNIRIKYCENKSGEEAVVLYSSGTTGASKGIILTHYAITTNADAILGYMNLSRIDCLYIAKSLSHSSTLTGELIVALRSGANVVLAPTIVPPRYVLNRIDEFSITTLCLNPTLLRMYSEEYRKKKFKINSLRTIYCSGSILCDRVYLDAHEVFKGIDIFNVYGLSEAGPRVAAQTKECSKSNSAGKAIQGVEFIIVDDNGIPVSKGERGVIHVNTPSRYSGYVTGSEKHKSLYRNWLNTGDIGYLDEFSELHIIDRVDDVIIVNAHKVYPGNLERLVLEIPNIIDCAVSGVVCNGVEMIGCLYVSEQDISLSTMHILKNTMAYYEIPKIVVRTDNIPKNSRGKVNRVSVKRILMESIMQKGDGV